MDAVAKWAITDLRFLHNGELTEFLYDFGVFRIKYLSLNWLQTKIVFSFVILRHQPFGTYKSGFEISILIFFCGGA